MVDVTVKLKLPKVRKAILRNFSLYSSAPVISVEFPDGVFCLAGANGLGKSTFLIAVNFGITGIVSEPDRKFESVEEYYQHSLRFSDQFFTGRITENDREAAEVSLEMDVGENLYYITRGIFDIEELREFTVTKGGVLIVRTDELTPSERHKEYTRRITQDVGLDIFEQLVFLQHFVLTFDERRHLLFWNQKTLEEAIYLAFGVDHAETKRAGSLRRESEKADSLARNFNWQATEVRKKIRELETTLTDREQQISGDTEIEVKHKELLEKLEFEKDVQTRLENELRDIRLRLAELSARQATLRTEYTEAFSARLEKKVHLDQHPIIRSTLLEARCGVCGTSGQEVVDRINRNLQTSVCPLCESIIDDQQTDAEYAVLLKKIDEEITAVRIFIDEATKTANRLSRDLDTAQTKFSVTRAEVENFEKANENQLQRLYKSTKDEGGINRVLESYRIQMEQYMRRKEEQYAKRNEKRNEWLKLQRNIEKQYAAMEEQFVPAFRDLAYRFLGIDLDVKMETGTTPGINLVVDVKNTARRQFHQLSESQRFFIDIALRMALVQYMTDPICKASLFVDTPEGSLDIAYESRAGDMFALFVTNGFRIVMTANINSSRLLRRLAERCGREKMQLFRMTSWTELSEVQISEEPQFEAAYLEIEQALLIKK